MNFFVSRSRLLTGCLLAVSGPTLVWADQTEGEVPRITVIGVADEQQRVVVDPILTPITQPQVGELLLRTPGANFNFNGPMTGIAQYRGMFAYRLRTEVNGLAVTPGGPNWMDAPLHYAPMPLLKTLEVQRGVTPVSAGPETIGGFVAAETIRSEFTNTSAFDLSANLNVSAQTVDNGSGVGGLIGLSNDTHRMHASGVYENGDNTEYPGGEIRPTEYERAAVGVGYGYTTGTQSIGIDYLRNETGPTGTPALGNDIDLIDTDLVSISYQGVFSDVTLTGDLYLTQVDHLMNNFGIRTPPPNPAMWRQVDAESTTYGGELSAAIQFDGAVLRSGVDGEWAGHDADITNPNNAFFVTNFNEIERDRYSVFGEWQTSAEDTWHYRAGARLTRVSTSAGEVGGTPANINPDAGALRDAFNAADRDLDWNLLDLVGTLSWNATETLAFDFTLARKERAPAYQELYLWLPLQATAGLADGNNYIGNLNLKKEQADTTELGLRWNWRASYLNPKVFYQRVDDYIQGTVTTNLNAENFCVTNAMCNPPVLEFTNVDAELYGVDTDFGVQFSENFRMDGVLSYVRGKRRDIDDNLYRIAPLSSVVGLSYAADRWQATVEGVFASKQNNVSVTNRETRSPGYGFMNLYGSVDLLEGVLLTAGVNNVFDKEYAPHTSGVNRAAGSDVPQGERLPGAGQSFFVRLNMTW